MHKDPYEDKKAGPAIWLLRLGLLFIVVTACVTASFLMYARWLGAAQPDAPWVASGATDLNPVRRLYLQAYLASKADELAEPIAPGSGPVEFVVESGQSAGGIAAALAQAGLLQDTDLFLNYLRFHGLDSQLEAGAYRVDPRWTIPELALGLTQSYAQEVELRFLEGWRVEEMAAYLSIVTPAEIDATTFLAIAQQRRPFDLDPYPFLAGRPAGGSSLEGYLFPDTYRVPLDADAAFLIDLMLRNFDRRVTPEMR
ncbi:MAG TPA: endolytic transglycosylase MltG, partial [Candidatus Binatia bacterium]|nr:endolytic transglycosylase MltG [Candidatus Binatia bacterium]